MHDRARPRLHVIDLLRVFAALSVMFFHLAYWSWANPRSRGASILQGTAEFPGLAAYAWWGWVGVDIFFVISGFVISYSSANVSFGRFVRSRFLRLFPAVLVCSTITFAVVVGMGFMPLPRAFEAYWRSVVIWPLGGWLDNVYWTLSVELTFYAVVAAFLLLGRPQWLAIAMAAIGLITSTYAVTSYLGGDTASIPGITQQLTDTLLLRHGMYFSLGYFVWAATTSGWTPIRSSLIALFLVGGAFPILASADSLARIPGAGPALVPLLIWLAATMVMIASVAFRPQGARPQGQWLTLLGMSTYPLYLIHYIAGATLMALLVQAGWSPGGALVASCLAMIACAIAVTGLVEIGPRRWFAGLIDLASRGKRSEGVAG